MSTADNATLFAALWPEADWTDEISAEFWRRVERLKIGHEQVGAVLREHRMTTRYRSPVPSDLLSKLKIAAGGDRVTKAIEDSSTYRPTPINGPVVTLREFRVWAAKNGIAVHPLLAGKIGKQDERRTKLP